MAEQTFRSPGFFEQEIDLAAKKVDPQGIPAGVIGTAKQGPAFVPVTVGSFADFETKFGTLDSDRFGPYAVREFLKNRQSVTFLRVLGAGSNETTAHFENTRKFGTVHNAGFSITGTIAPRSPDPAYGGGGHTGVVQFICADHDAVTNEGFGYRTYSDNDSINSVNSMRLVRGVVLMATGTKLELLHATSSYQTTYFPGMKNSCVPGKIDGSSLVDADKYFKIVLSSSAAGGFASDEGKVGLKILSASLDPNSAQYIGNILNTDPRKFQEEEHLLYLDLPVEHEIAPVRVAANTHTIALMSGSENKAGVQTNGSGCFLSLFGNFNTRYTTPKTTSFISQPYGAKEYDLFHFETLSDGSDANSKYKISIANLRASTDSGDKFGTFEVQVRAFSDTDTNIQILERYPNLNLNPDSDRYIARVIGDKKVQYDFDQIQKSERRLVVQGKFPNLSQRIRVRMNGSLEAGEVPADAIPFGFRGLPGLKTSDSMTDITSTALTDRNSNAIGDTQALRLTSEGLVSNAALDLSGSLLPPVPYRFKVTRGQVAATGLKGQPGTDERVDNRFYWGVRFERIPRSTTDTNGILNTNTSNIPNPLIKTYTKFQGISKLDTLLSGAGADLQHNNKFSLSRVAFMNMGTTLAGLFTEFTGSARDHMKGACYIRNGAPDKNTYTITDNTQKRYTLASLVHTSSVVFNRFTPFAKYSTHFHGGFDGLNILDKDSELFRDRAFSSDANGKAVENTNPDIGIGVSTANPMGQGRLANANASVHRAIDIMTDPISTNINVLAIPGVRDPFVTDHAIDKIEDYGMAVYVMDTLKYGENGLRLYDDSPERVVVRDTAEKFTNRAIDSSYTATFFPDVFINDPVNNKTVKVPASVAALGTLGFNDRVSFPWFAPAGFNRGGLDFVVNVETRLSADDRDVLYDARVNPIATFPRNGFVIFGQKTLQQAKSALDRINVRRLLLEVKRQVVRVADRILFEPNTPQTRATFVGRVTPLLSVIQAQAGIEQFKVVMDNTNNTSADVESNRLNGRIIVVPTRAVEFIAIDFIITNSGVQFE